MNFDGFSPNLVCVLILWRSGLRLLIGNFRQFLTELSARDTYLFSFQDNKVNKNLNGFSPNFMCIYIVEIFYGIANGQISSIFYSYLPAT